MCQEQTSSENASDSQGVLVGHVEAFAATLGKHGLELKKTQTDTLQVNVGLLCNQACMHCHLECGPNRSEIMSQEIIEAVVAYAERAHFQNVDITGGAPEMNPHLDYLIENMAPVVSRMILRVNLSALAERNLDCLLELCKTHRVTIVASLPSLNSSQTDSQRGEGVFYKSIAMLTKLNESGYGINGMGLELNLVSNPTGAFLPAPQAQAEEQFKSKLDKKWGIVFNNLYSFANVPLGRFRDWLVASGNYQQYMSRLTSGFNPCALTGLMCRTLVSVSWDGYLYDCDFNQAAGIPLGGIKTHVSEVERFPVPGTAISTAEHCYACTVGAGFT